MTPTGAAGEGKELYYLVAPSLHEGVMKTEQKEERDWASRGGKEESFCESNYAKLTSQTTQFNSRNGIYNSFCKIISPLLSNMKYFITHFFNLKIAHPRAPANWGKGGGNYFPKNSLYSSAWIYFLGAFLCFHRKEKSRLWPSLRSFFSLWSTLYRRKKGEREGSSFPSFLLLDSAIC